MRTLFISDLHLSEQTPHINALFFKFLTTETKNADALYILGDFFELWIGDDDHNPFHEKVAQALSDVAKRIPVYFMHGNRDFLLGKKFAAQCHMQLLEDPTAVNLYGRRVLLMHGDSLCTEDKAYQQYRKTVHNRFLQKCFLKLPLSWRRKIAQHLRQKSQQHSQYKNNALMDVSLTAVEQHLSQQQCNLLIHGHTHQPAIHVDQTNTRAVLGAWHEIGNYLEYHDNHCIFLRNSYS